MLSNLVSQSNTKIRIFLSFYTNKVTTDYTRRSITFSKLISSKSLFFFFALQQSNCRRLNRKKNLLGEAAAYQKPWQELKMEMHKVFFTLKTMASAQDGNESLKSQDTRSFYPNNLFNLFKDSQKPNHIVALAIYMEIGQLH